MKTLLGKNYTDKKQFVKEYNVLRLKNKGCWVYFNGIIEDKEVTIKTYNTSIQILRVNGCEGGGVWDLKVSEFKNKILQAL